MPIGRTAALLLTALLPPYLQAQDSVPDKRTRIVHADASYGFSTVKSKTLESNDTGSAMRVNAGAHVGAEKEFAIGLEYETAAAAFELTDHALAKKDADVLLNYRISYFSLGLVVASSELTISDAGTDVIQLSASGYGGNAAVFIPIGKGSMAYLKVKTATFSETTDVIDETTALASRMTVDLGGNVLLSREVFYMVFGYRQETFNLSFGGSSNTDLMTTTYVGFGMGFDF